MIANILTKIYMYFTANKIGVLIRIFFSNFTIGIISEIMNKQNQEKAYEFVKELNANTQLSNVKKAQLFNKKLFAWALETCKKELSEAVINCLREFAVCAVKADEEEKENKAA